MKTAVCKPVVITLQKGQAGEKLPSLSYNQASANTSTALTNVLILATLIKTEAPAALMHL